MDIGDLLDQISDLRGRSYRLKGRYAAGENHGAYAVKDASGTLLVLKWMIRPDSVALARLERARRVTERMRTTGVPVPCYTLIDTLPEGVTYWLQTTLPGQPPARLSVEQIHQLLIWNERQAGQALSAEQDWSWYVRAVVFAGKSGWKDSLRDYSAETRAVLSGLEQVTAGKEAGVPRTGDLVHGDLVPGNVLVAEGKVTGIVDWDAAGCGDRALDLSKLLFYSYEHTLIRSLLRQRIATMSGADALTVYLAYNILAQLDWAIRHHTRAAVEEWVVKTSFILADIRRESPDVT